MSLSMPQGGIKYTPSTFTADRKLSWTGDTSGTWPSLNSKAAEPSEVQEVQCPAPWTGQFKRSNYMNMHLCPCNGHTYHRNTLK